MVVVDRRERAIPLAARLRAERLAASRSGAGREAVAARVRRHEQKYGIRSEELRAALGRGEIAETEDVTRWLIEYDLLRRVRGR